MEKLANPSFIDEFKKIGGVIDFSFFAEIESLDASIPEAFASHLSSASMWSTDVPNTVDLDAIESLPRRSIWKKDFLGDWYDPEAKLMRLVGGGKLTDGTELENPSFDKLYGKKTSNWGSWCPEPGSGGQFGYAFSQPPYGLQADYAEIQRIFDLVIEYLFEKGVHTDVTDWSSPELVKLSSYFSHGLDWWGVFLFTLFSPANGRLTVISASTSD
jgi:hypothetical protein